MYRLGIDVGGTNISAGIVDENFKIIEKIQTKTSFFGEQKNFCNQLCSIYQKIISKAHISSNDIVSIGIGMPGTVNLQEGILEFSSNLKFSNFHVKKMLKLCLNKKILLENDANAAAWGEYIAGAAKNAKSAIVLTIGTGIGGGIILNDKILHGINFNGAEIGHMVIVNKGKKCSCGRLGCFEAYASASALAHAARKAVLKKPSSIIYKLVRGDLQKINSKIIFSSARKNDPLAQDLIKNYLGYLSCGIVNLINIFQPEIFLIGGGVSYEGDSILNYVKNYTEKYRYSKNASSQTKISIAQLKNDAGIIGAAFLKNF